jgi:hypothetical protein
MKSSAACADASGEVFAKSAHHCIEHQLASRDVIFAAMQKAANAVGQPGENPATRFVKAFSGSSARIDGTLLAAFNRLEQVSKLGTGETIPLREMVQSGDEEGDEPRELPRLRITGVASSTQSSQTRGGKAGDEDPEQYWDDVEQSDEETRTNVGRSDDGVARRFEEIIDATKRAHPELSTSQAIDVALRDAPGRSALRASVRKSLEANRTHG